MSARDLRRDPCWQAGDLGHPLPDSPHAVSVALPTWRDVIAYEENDPNCRGALRTVYPRSVCIHWWPHWPAKRCSRPTHPSPRVRAAGLIPTELQQPRLRCTAGGNDPTELRISKPSMD